MNRRWSIIFIVGLFAAFACEKKAEILPPIRLDISPRTGLTTSIFTFDLTKTLEYYENDRIFVRWDWEGDGIFDTPFLNEKILTHRFYAPGSYYPKAEIKNLEGLSSDSSFQIEVGRGYSNPKAAFKISPQGGHIHTIFTLDANNTKDDEDSLSTLSFKWDFEGDGIWDTDLGKSPVVEYVYPEPDVYWPNLYVEDPGRRGSVVKQRLEVTLIDTCLKPEFIAIPELIIQNEDVIFDASISHNICRDDDDFLYRWDFNNDRFFDTEWSDDPVAVYSFPVEQYYDVRLQIRNSMGLENTITEKFWIYHQNQPPRAKFNVSTYGGNTNTSIRFDSWAGWDLEDSPSQMLRRWDWDNDGNWDSELNYEKVVFHTFDAPGDYTVAMELIDRGGLKDTAYLEIYINDSDYESDLLIDKRGTGWNYYGTVKIGDQWWITKNLQVNDRLYDNEPYMCGGVVSAAYGYLYPYHTLPIVCPDGWRVPSRDDWNKLLDNLPSDDYYDELVLGGNAGFNAVFGGSIGETGCSLGKRGYYWSTTKPRDQNFISVWVITFDSVNQQMLKGYHLQASKFSIRCMKDD